MTLEVPQQINQKLERKSARWGVPSTLIVLSVLTALLVSQVPAPAATKKAKPTKPKASSTPIPVKTTPSPVATSAPAPKAASKAVAGKPDQRAKKLTIALNADSGPLNLFAGYPETIGELVYDKLLAPNPYVASAKPWLASSVTMIDPSNWEVTLRDGVTWHDGVPLTPADVEFTFDYMRKVPTGRFTHHVNEVPDFDTKVSGPKSVRMTCTYPCPDLGTITLADLPIIPKHIWSKISAPRTHTGLPIGTGPYKLISYDRTTGYRFVANDKYFAGKPLVDELVMPVIIDPSAAFTALRTGAVDAVAAVLPPELLDTFNDTKGIKVASTKPLQILELRLNYDRFPFDDPKVRQAFSLAVNRQEILDVIQLGQGRLGDRGYPHPDSAWTNPTLSTPSDSAKASKLFDATLGSPRKRADGSPLVLNIRVLGSNPTQVRAAELVVKHLAKVGVVAEVTPLDGAAMTALFTNRNFDMAIGVIGAHGVADPTQFIMSHRSGYLWAAAIAYPEWDTLFARWKGANTVGDRSAVSFEMQRLFNNQPTSVTLAYPDENWAFRPEAFDGWVETLSYGIVHKWSLLPHDIGRSVGAIRTEY